MKRLSSKVKNLLYVASFLATIQSLNAQVNGKDQELEEPSFKAIVSPYDYTGEGDYEKISARHFYEGKNDSDTLVNLVLKNKKDDFFRNVLIKNNPAMIDFSGDYLGPSNFYVFEAFNFEKDSAGDYRISDYIYKSIPHEDSVNAGLSIKKKDISQKELNGMEKLDERVSRIKDLSDGYGGKDEIKDFLENEYFDHLSIFYKD